MSVSQQHASYICDRKLIFEVEKCQKGLEFVCNLAHMHATFVQHCQFCQPDTVSCMLNFRKVSKFSQTEDMHSLEVLAAGTNNSPLAISTILPF